MEGQEGAAWSEERGKGNTVPHTPFIFLSLLQRDEKLLRAVGFGEGCTGGIERQYSG